MTAFLARYRKTIAALVGALLTWFGSAYVPDGQVTRVEYLGLAIALATVLGVYGVSNEPLPEPPPSPAPDPTHTV